MCQNHIAKGWHESRVKRAEVSASNSMSDTKRVIVEQSKIKVAEPLLHTTVCLTIFEKCPIVAHEPQYCNLRKPR